jgi:hypothetical protein
VDIVIAVICVIVGVVFVVFARQLVELGASLRFSYEELRAESGPTHRRVRRTIVFWRAVYSAFGIGCIYLGIRALVG